MVVTYNDVLAMWMLKRNVQETKRTHTLELLVMRLRDSMRPHVLITAVGALKDTNSPVTLFHTNHPDDICQEACTTVNTSLPTWMRTSSVCGIFYASTDLFPIR